MKCVALDIGSSTIKGAMLDLAARGIRRITSRPFPARLPGLPAHYFEVDPHEIEQAAREVLEELCAFAPTAKRLYVAGQMGGLVLLDSQAQPSTNYLSWRDLRTHPGDGGTPTFLQQLRQRICDETVRSLGCELQAGSTLTLLHWLSQRNELPHGTTPLTVADYVITRLCGTKGHMHLTHAIGLLDLRSVDWHHDVFRTLGVDDLHWPRLVHWLDPVGKCRIGSQEWSVYGAYGDQQCALLGANLERAELSINLSTGSQVSRRIERLDTSDVQTRAYFGGDLLQTITHLPAGRSLNVLVQLLTEIAAAAGSEVRDPWSAISRLAGNAADSAADHSSDQLAVDLSFFAGPFGSTGSITGITTENLTVGQLFNAAFQSMADNYARCAKRIDPARSCKQVVLSGSLARSLPILRRLIQQRFDVPLRCAGGDEETLLGLLEIARQEIPQSRPSPLNH